MINREDIKDVLEIINELEHFVVINKKEEAIKNISDLQNFFESELEEEQKREVH
ncbi:hypothetical protein [Metaclostridioides mangenotii]|uniref:hypothetical protein n=1 Tax=Metaclostridioides mangenotii TaxID=1540 RepID=UPI0028E7CF43|nr:hypothetical protein [Clostridioides mangenotii]